MTTIDRSLLRANDPVAMRELMQAGTRVCRAIAARYGVGAYGDDITQVVTMAFLKANATPREDENEIPIEAFFSLAGRRAAVACMKASKRMRGFGEGETVDNFVGHEHDPTGNHYADTAPLPAPPPRPTTPPPALPAPRAPVARAKPARGPRPAVSAPSDNILRATRKRWGLTQVRMAHQLGISLRALRNYEYGSVDAIPRKVIDAMRVLKHRLLSGRYSDDGEAQFHKKLSEWTALIGLVEGDYLNLAAYLGLARSTTWRWFNGGGRPSRERIDAYDIYIRETVAHRQRQMARALQDRRLRTASGGSARGRE